MYSKILILVGILAAGIASADVPLSVEHDVTYALAESVGISSTRSLRAMTEQTAMSVTASSVCDTMSEKSGGLLDLLVLLDLTLIGATDAKDFQACCNACVDSDICIAFNFRLLDINACLLIGSLSGRTGSLLSLQAALNIL